MLGKYDTGFNISLHVQVRLLFWSSIYVNMTVFVAWFDLNIFGCMHNLKQTYDYVLMTVRSQVGRGDICRGRSIFRAWILLEMSRLNNYEMSADASNYDSQNVGCQSLISSSKTLSKITIGVWEGILLGGRKKCALKMTTCPKIKQVVLKLTFLV